MKRSHTLSDLYNVLANKLESAHTPAPVSPLTINSIPPLKSHNGLQGVLLGMALRGIASEDERQLIIVGEHACSLPQGLRQAASLNRAKKHIHHLLLRQALFIMLLGILTILGFQLVTRVS